jgi:hypothetical protein
MGREYALNVTTEGSSFCDVLHQIMLKAAVMGLASAVVQTSCVPPADELAFQQQTHVGPDDVAVVCERLMLVIILAVVCATQTAQNLTQSARHPKIQSRIGWIRYPPLLRHLQKQAERPLNARRDELLSRLDVWDILVPVFAGREAKIFSAWRYATQQPAPRVQNTVIHVKDVTVCGIHLGCGLWSDCVRQCVRL